jgi:hypothetical protein
MPFLSGEYRIIIWIILLAGFQDTIDKSNADSARLLVQRINHSTSRIVAALRTAIKNSVGCTSLVR